MATNVLINSVIAEVPVPKFPISRPGVSVNDHTAADEKHFTPTQVARRIGPVLKSEKQVPLRPRSRPNWLALFYSCRWLSLKFVLLLLVVASVPGANLGEHTHKPGDPAPPFTAKLSANSPPAKSASGQDTISSLGASATDFLNYPPVANCSKKGCGIIVTSFILPDGNTSAYGIQLADELSNELASKSHKIQVIDRALLQDFLAKDRVPAKSVNAGLVRSIAFAMNARFVVLGTTTRTGDDVVQLSTRLFDVADKSSNAYTAVINLPAPKSTVDLSPAKLFAPLPSITSTASGEPVYRPGVDGVSMPKCTYMPNPSSEDALKFHLSGTIFADAILNADGRLESVRIVRGLPDGLNDRTIATMKTWLCNPALKDGKPVATQLYFEVNFNFRPN